MDGKSSRGGGHERLGVGDGAEVVRAGRGGLAAEGSREEGDVLGLVSGDVGHSVSDLQTNWISSMAQGPVRRKLTQSG